MLAKIKSFMNKIRKFYLFRKLVLSFLLFFVIALLFIVLIGAIYFEDSAEKSLEYVVSLQMDQAEAVVEQTVSPIVPVINSILSTHSVDAFFSSNAVDRVNEQKLLLSLRALQNSYEQIQNISLFSATNNRFLGTQGVSSQYIPGVVEGMEEPLGEMLGIPYFVRETPRNINIQNSPIVSTLTFVFRPRNYRADCAVIIDVQMAYLIDTIAEHIGEGTEVALLGMEGQPIIGKEEIVGLLVPEQLGEHDSMQLSVSMGRTIVQWRLMKQLACYVAVEIPYDQVMPYTNSLLSVSIIVCALFVLVGIVVTGILVNRIYNPIDTLIQKQELFEKNEMTTQHATVDEIKVFYAKVQDYAQRVQMLEMYQSDYSSTQNGNWIWHLLRGNVEYAEKTMRFTQWDSSSFFEKKFCVAVVVVDEYRAYCEMVDETGRKLNDFAMSNILEELLRPHLIESAIRVEENILAVVCGLSNTSLMEEMVFVLREF